MADLNSISNRLKSTVATLDFSAVEKSAESAIQKFDATSKGILGGTVNEVKGGVESLTEEIDEAELLNKVFDGPAITKITQNVPNIANKFFNEVKTSSDIQSITGTISASVPGFLNDIITSNTPNGIEESLKTAVNATKSELSTALKDVTEEQLKNIVTEAVGKIPHSEFISNASSFANQINQTIRSISDFYIVDFAENINRNFENALNSIIDKSMSLSDLEQTYLSVANKDFESSFELVKKYIDLPENFDFITKNIPQSDWSPEIIEAVNKVASAQSNFRTLDVELSTYTSNLNPANGSAGVNSKSSTLIGDDKVGAKTGTSKSGDTWNFDDVGSTDELEGMFRNINRSPGKEIAGAIVHWSATFLNQNVGSAWIHDIHIRERDFEGVGYHLIIRRDGTLQRGRPLNRRGAHDINNNETFLGFCFIGGYNATSKGAKKPFWKYNSSDSFTAEQWNTYDTLMSTFHKVFPSAQVNGHYATSNDGKEDPGFDVPGYSASKFGHKNIIPDSDPRWKSTTPITIEAIRAEAVGAT
jgi:N-acetylmuramoyl-L-alanine amidase